MEYNRFSNLLDVCKKLNIQVRTYNERDAYLLRISKKGLCCISNGMPYIFIYQNQCLEECQFTIAHELGHILLGHVGEIRTTDNYVASINPIEQSADDFANWFLSPPEHRHDYFLHILESKNICPIE